MRSRPLLALALLLALAFPSLASAKAEVGISENQPALFSDPLFTPLGIKDARVVVAYDVIARGGPDLARVQQYLASAQAAGVQPLVTFEHSRGDASACNVKRNDAKRVCALPTVAQYKKAVQQFLARFPQVKLIAPWNEMNHYTQPTSRDPARAAQFVNTVHSLCKDCQLVVADVLDQADLTDAKLPTFVSTGRFIAKFRAALKVPRTICGIHDYSDVNRFRTSGTKALMRDLGCKQYWLTETGGLYKFGSFWTKKSEKAAKCTSAASCQLKATKFLFTDIVDRMPAIKRVYVYTWFGGVTSRFDSGLVAGGKPRPAYAEVAAQL
jgi:hypothetical protein